MSEDQQQSTITKENTGITISFGDQAAANLPAVAEGHEAVVADSSGGLSYATATAVERTEMDRIITSIDLENPETVIVLGQKEREDLSILADNILDSIQPSVKLAFAEAMRELIDFVKENSLSQIKDRISDGALSRGFNRLIHVFTSRKELDIKASKKMIERFMTDISGTRKIITEMVDRLQDQQKNLNDNFSRINEQGLAIVKSAQRMRIVNAATEEYIRRVKAGEITTLKDLQDTAERTNRADDAESLQTAQDAWALLLRADADLLSDIGVYDMNVANLAFTKRANYQNRLKTATTLTSTIAEWKTQLAIFATVTQERVAAALLDQVGEMTSQAIKQNQDLFESLVDAYVEGSAKGTYKLRDIIEAQGKMAEKLEGVSAQVEKNFAELANDRQALKESISSFRRRAVQSQRQGYVGTAPQPKP